MTNKRDQAYLDLYSYAVAMTIISLVLFVVLLGIASGNKAFREPLGNLKEEGVVCTKKMAW